MGEAVADRVDARTIVVGVDGSEASDGALDWAIAEAGDSGRELLLVYAVSVTDELATALLPLVGAPEASDLGDEVLQRSASKCKEAAVPHREAKVEGTPTDVLTEVSTKAAMLVLGAPEGRAAHPEPLDSVIQKCLRRCHCPFVLVKTPARPKGTQPM